MSSYGSGSDEVGEGPQVRPDCTEPAGPAPTLSFMGFQQHVVVSSAVSADDRQAILSAAFTRWPFARSPHNPDSYPDRVVFAPPELTSYQFSGSADSSKGFEQNIDVKNGLPEWSRAFPTVTFAYIEANCFGGGCDYTGYCCRDGDTVGGTLVEETVSEPDPPADEEPMTAESLRRRVEARMVRTYGGLQGLLEHVGIELETGYFEPFVRGYFSELREEQWLAVGYPIAQARSSFGKHGLHPLSFLAQVVKIVNEELTSLMGESSRQVTLSPA